MKALRFALLALLRDWNSGELRVLLLALIVAVAALTAVGFFTSRVSAAVDQQAGEVLAADLRIESGRPLQTQYEDQARRLTLKSAQIVSFPSVVFLGETSALSAVRAVSSGYPLRGHLKIADAAFGTVRETDALPGRGEAWVDARLMSLLGAQPGSFVRIGESQLRITKVLEYRPDQGMQFIDVAPTLLMNIDELPATRLVQPGSRVSYIALFAGERTAVVRFKQWLIMHKQSGERVVDVADASPQIRSATERAGRFLNLSGLTSVLLAAIAVAMAARRYAERHLDSVALLKSMGASQRFVLQLTLLELMFLGLIAWLAGTVLGYAAQEGLAWILRDLIRGTLPPPSLAASGLGLITTIAVLAGFALPPLVRLRRVPPIRVLRRNAEPPPLSYLALYGIAAIAVVAMVYWITGDVQLVSYVTAGTFVTFAVLFAAGWMLVALLQNFRGSVGVSWRYGVANIARRGNESIVQIVAFGLGLMILLLLAVVRSDLLADWKASLPRNAPNYFMINIPPNAAADLRAFFSQRSLELPELVPMVRARLTSINGVDAQLAKGGDERARNFLSREANLTWSQTLQPDNKIVAGRWWTQAEAAGAQVSVEKDLANSLRLKLGDRLGYDVAGEKIEATVTSFRTVQWDSFRPNFFMIFSPGVLDDSSGTLICSLHLPPDQRTFLAELAKRFPQITVIDIESILTQVRGVMDKASLAVQYVFLFTLCAGIAVLLAAIQSTRDERRYESAMLRTLGASRRTVLQGVAAEFTALGLLSGVLAATGASIAGYFLATRLFNLKYTLDPALWATGLIAGVVLVAVSGTLATRSVVNSPPLTTLRRE